MVAGLAPAEPGYRRLGIKPWIRSGLTHARVAHDTPFGRAEVGWQVLKHAVEIDAVVPPNTSATVTLPGEGSKPFEVGSGTYRWLVARGSQPHAVASTTA